jgi:phage/plasmid-like protein (TIGR03299 family)
MAHQIETHGNRAAALFARTDPWHRLGTTVAGEAFTAQDAMTLGHLGGWNVRKAPVSATEIREDGVTTMEVPGAYATVRTNPFTGQTEPLAVVGAGYHPLQNEEHAEFLNHLADASGAIFDTAGSLRGGRQVFVTMRLPKHLHIGGSDRVDLNIAALNSHDGNSAFRLLVTPVRVVCANTQHAALRDHVSSWSIRHTRNAKTAVQAARDTLGLTFAYVEAFEVEAERMINTTITDARVLRARRLPVRHARGRRPVAHPQRGPPTRTATLSHLWHDAATQSGIAGTAWAAYQSVVEYVDHYAPVRDKSNAATARAVRLLTTDEPARLKSAAWTALAPA